MNDPAIMQFQSSQRLFDPNNAIGFGLRLTASQQKYGITMEQFNYVMSKMVREPTPTNAVVTRVIYSHTDMAVPLNDLLLNHRKDIGIIIAPFLMGNYESGIGHFTVGAFFLHDTRRAYFLDSKHGTPNSLFDGFKTKLEHLYGNFDVAPQEECNAVTNYQDDNIFCATHAFKNAEKVYFGGIPRLLTPFNIEDEFKRLDKIIHDRYQRWPPTRQEKIQNMSYLKRELYLRWNKYI